MGYLSEENAKDEPNYFEAKSDCCWVLDPLYVTKDFIQEAGNYAMHLGLNYKQKPFMGVFLSLRKINYGSLMEEKVGENLDMEPT